MLTLDTFTQAWKYKALDVIKLAALLSLHATSEMFGLSQ